MCANRASVRTRHLQIQEQNINLVSLEKTQSGVATVAFLDDVPLIHKEASQQLAFAVRIIAKQNPARAIVGGGIRASVFAFHDLTL
jgi:hypothetical protein